MNNTTQNLPKDDIQVPLAQNLQSINFCEWLMELEKTVISITAHKYKCDVSAIMAESTGMEDCLNYCKTDTKFALLPTQVQTKTALRNALFTTISNSVKTVMLKRLHESKQGSPELPSSHKYITIDDILDDRENNANAVAKITKKCNDIGVVFEDTDTEHSLKLKIAKSKGSNSVRTVILEYVVENGWADTDTMIDFVSVRLPHISKKTIAPYITKVRNEGKVSETATAKAKAIYKPEMTMDEFFSAMSLYDVKPKTLRYIWKTLKEKK